MTHDQVTCQQTLIVRVYEVNVSCRACYSVPPAGWQDLRESTRGKQTQAKD